MWRYGLAVALLCTWAAGHDLLAQALPNLRPHQLDGWSAPLLVRTNLSSLADTSFISEGHDIYIGWAALNDSSVDISSENTNVFFVQVLINGQVALPTRRFSRGLAAQSYIWIEDANIGPLPIGNHILRLGVDSDANITESSETDNTYERQITVVSSNGLPTHLQNARIAGGSFEFTVSGSPGRYAVERSLNFQGWSVVGSVTNISGTVTFSDVSNLQNAAYRVRKE